MQPNQCNRPKADNPHIEAAQRIRQLGIIFSRDRAEAKAFLQETGVFTASGKLTAPYR